MLFVFNFLFSFVSISLLICYPWLTLDNKQLSNEDCLLNSSKVFVRKWVVDLSYSDYTWPDAKVAQVLEHTLIYPPSVFAGKEIRFHGSYET
jgi:hypothetical protein